MPNNITGQVMPAMGGPRLLPRGGYDHDALSDATRFETGGSTLVQQQFAVEVDINTIVKRFGLTGQRPSGELAGVYGDFTGVVDYASAVEAIARAEAGFMALPADVRLKFDNDPAKLLSTVAGVPDADLEARIGLPTVEPVVQPIVASGPAVAVPAPVPA